MYTRIFLAFAVFAVGFYSCKSDSSCPENCIQITGFVKDSFTGDPTVGGPYEIYWVKKKTVAKLDVIDTGSTDQQGRINKNIQIDRGRFDTHWIFVRLLPTGKFKQITGTYVTEVIEEYAPAREFNFVILERKG